MIDEIRHGPCFRDVYSLMGKLGEGSCDSTQEMKVAVVAEVERSRKVPRKLLALVTGKASPREEYSFNEYM